MSQTHQQNTQINSGTFNDSTVSMHVGPTPPDPSVLQPGEVQQLRAELEVLRSALEQSRRGLANSGEEALEHITELLEQLKAERPRRRTIGMMLQALASGLKNVDTIGAIAVRLHHLITSGTPG